MNPVQIPIYRGVPVSQKFAQIYKLEIAQIFYWKINFRNLLNVIIKDYLF